MFRYLRALWYYCTGRVDKARQALGENQYVMAATYDAAIAKSQDRFRTVKDAVSELVTVEQERVREIKEESAKVERLDRIRTGAKASMQSRINTLRTEGRERQEIESDPEFVRHRKAYEDADRSCKESEKNCQNKEADLKDRQHQLAVYKAELQSMQRQAEKLQAEKQEALADVAIARQSEAINATLAGISQDTTDNDLAEARSARQRAKARAHVTAELTGNDARVAENEYLRQADQITTGKELDGLLDWGDDKSPEMTPAKLPE